ncbi:ABC transporter substrate-binding protein [Variovorax paradoxus]|jgi:tripartite-type tricarboxylate transporter receptor subunit TctC|uniref:Bug family tripartite tricarboxylate transporter substrate binding protein n=1 Tax=Variovorax TaxID=34072 RepID=UPI0006E6C4A3|nr:tripartite tricarboxylate transporter substrate-binding protein [Variovorax sp. CY25R-8]KPU94675.1 ABC transporter substrate-binding protein [Variovorax paradoxus]KPV08864.1 ABC transporter substrate-binding protein [Variovorax paradoxus]KPV11361.1 ABC transporter substrate-binding protein [Variovorax paradoxus]KPV23253.1 ABC transporter substrate-binding protein [Variovorax paradoxus]KPV31181.1 ABC transporter substrate-binding protein [Variovorax paradoxus]
MKTTTPTIFRSRRLALRAATVFGLAGLLATPMAWAQKYPDKPIRLIVGYSAGGGVDAVARLLSARLPAVLGQQVLVENRTGATGLIAADFVAKAPPDGYTLMMGDSALLIAKLLQPKIAIDPLTSFKPVAGAFVSPLMIVTGNDFPAKTPAEFVAQLKANPGRFSFATSGVGTVQHLGFEMLKQSTGSFVVHVPYRGAAQIVPDVIGGQVPIGVVSATAAMAQSKAGKLRAVALMNSAKLEGAENIAPLADALPGFDVAPRIFVLAPAGTPNEIVDRFSAAVKTVLDAPDAGTAAAAQGTLRAYATPAQLGKDMAEETVRWKRIITEQRIVADGG